MKTEANDLVADFKAATVSPGGVRAREPKFAVQLKKILVPVDFSTCSTKALQYAVPFARQFGAELTLLHVIPPVVVLPTSEVPPEGLIQESDTAARNNLEEIRRSLGDDLSSRALLRYGSPAMEILDAAKEMETDLIILSTHGHTGLKHILLGNTAEKVVRRAHCPVLIVREHEHDFITVTAAES